mmetsp:Transcript_85160/g.156041  ORF Transcript_85160/g.156041 Transcript_85160/m.156041 type:complete len:88 (-) Transcript_85160:89-352(-)
MRRKSSCLGSEVPRWLSRRKSISAGESSSALLVSTGTAGSVERKWTTPTNPTAKPKRRPTLMTSFFERPYLWSDESIELKNAMLDCQ